MATAARSRDRSKQKIGIILAKIVQQGQVIVFASKSSIDRARDIQP